MKNSVPQKHKKIPCPFHACPKTFSCSAKLQDHLNTHTDTRNFGCPVCGRTYPSKKSLDAHGKNHRPPAFECKKCGRNFVQKSHLKRHLGTCGSKFECGICGKTYQRRGNFAAHMERKHKNKKFALEKK